MESYVQVTIEATDPTLHEILVALLSEAGYEGFEEERSVLKAFISASLHDIGREHLKRASQHWRD